MDSRAAKLALARKKLKDHQNKITSAVKDEAISGTEVTVQESNMQIINTTKEQDNLGANNMNNDAMNVTNNLFEASSNQVKDCEPLQHDLNVTELLIASKRNLEMEINELQAKFNSLENDHSLTVNNLYLSTQRIHQLENELRNLQDNYSIATKELHQNKDMINELNNTKSSIIDQNNNLMEQLEFTKTMLTAKETENASLNSQLSNLQNQLEGTKLQLQQLINGKSFHTPEGNEIEGPLQNEVLLHKLSTLEHQLKISQKERDQISMHYEHYVTELNEQLKSVTTKNEEMSMEILNLSNRESSLIDQISELEIRLQNYKFKGETMECQAKHKIDLNELQKNYNEAQDRLRDVNSKYEELQKKYLESISKIKELTEVKQSEYKQEDISFSKLNADIASDKIAAQKATEQNRKLKVDMQELEEAFVKMSRDKLELTEKLTAEKFLNRELTIKLAEVDEKAKDMHIKLMAKDEEMIRLQSSYRNVEKEYEKLFAGLKNTENNEVLRLEQSSIQGDCCNEAVSLEERSRIEIEDPCEDELMLLQNNNDENSVRIKKEDAMLKLQERFLKIMGEVADLSDEKHRLEHIILQLQNETDTICEYVALYQQQRSLLKKRDQERGEQIKMFQEACDKLKSQVDELSSILIRFAEDKDLIQYFEVDSRRNDLEKVKRLISHLKNNCLIDPKRKNVDFKNFYPCSCCSGRLLEV